MAELSPIDLAEFARSGFAYYPDPLISTEQCFATAETFADMCGAGARHLLDAPAVLSVLREPALRTAVLAVLGPGAFAYKATLFDKRAKANWLVAWHQDVSIPVSRKLQIDGWQGWSTKDGVQYVQAPDKILSGLLALRLHLDPCASDDGPLRVLAGSHALGKVRQAEIEVIASRYEEHSITGVIGSALLMRPLLLHASSKSSAGRRRRVLHLEFAATELPDGLEWHRRISL